MNCKPLSSSVEGRGPERDMPVPNTSCDSATTYKTGAAQRTKVEKRKRSGSGIKLAWVTVYGASSWDTLHFATFGRVEIPPFWTLIMRKFSDVTVQIDQPGTDTCTATG